MKIKLTSILDLNSLYEKLKQNTSLTIKTKFQLNRLFLEISPHIDFYKNELNLLVQKYAARDDNNEIITNDNGVSIQKENIEEFSKRMVELQDTEVEISEYSFSEADFDKVSDEITVMDLMALMPFIKE